MSRTLDEVGRVQPGGRSREVEQFSKDYMLHVVLRMDKHTTCVQTHPLCANTNELLFFTDDLCSLCIHIT